MRIVSHAYNSDEDFASVMTFLRETFNKTNSYQNWFPDRFEDNLGRFEELHIIDDIRIWEEANDEVAPSKKRIVAFS